MNLPPIQEGEIYVRCPKCHLIGWTVDDDRRLMPFCPDCEEFAEKFSEGMDGTMDIRLIEGAPTDAAHHLDGWTP